MARDVEGLRPTVPTMSIWSTRTVIAALTIGIMLCLGGCNTMQGFGRDVEKAGEAIQKSTK